MCSCKILEKHGLYPTWYTIECIDNGGHKKYYAFAMANDNAAIEYAETVLCPNATSEDLVTDYMQHVSTIMEPLDGGEMPAPANISLSYMQANPSASITPKITITKPQVQVFHSTNCDSSKITGTSLFGVAGGGIFLPKDGVWNVTPGVYHHKVQGSINGYTPCEIRSQLYYE